MIFKQSFAIKYVRFVFRILVNFDWSAYLFVA